jgi:uncharacterized membrane protein YjjP (DUF1212 family)
MEHAQAGFAVYLCLLLGRILFSFGATTQRIQDSIACLARHLGCNVEILVSYDALMITVWDKATFRTRIDSPRGVAGLNLLGLIRISELLRSLPNSRTSGHDLERELCGIRDAPPIHGAVSQTLAAGCAGAGFCVANGGDPLSWASSFVAAGFIFSIRRPLAARHFNVHLTVFAIALAGSLLAGLLARGAHSATPAIAAIGTILFLVPGAPMINGGIDIVRNHVTIGIARAGFTLAVLGAMCLGLGLTIPMLSLRVTPPFSVTPVWNMAMTSLAGALAAGALAWMNNGAIPLMALCALGGFTGRLVRALTSLGGVDLITGSLIGVLSSTLIVSLIAERLRWPGVVASVIAALPMVPGYFAIAGLNSLLVFAAANNADPAQLALGVQALTRALFISVALVVGVIGPVVILQHGRPRI